MKLNNRSHGVCYEMKIYLNQKCYFNGIVIKIVIIGKMKLKKNYYMEIYRLLTERNLKDVIFLPNPRSLQ